MVSEQLNKFSFDVAVLGDFDVGRNTGKILSDSIRGLCRCHIVIGSVAGVAS